MHFYVVLGLVEMKRVHGLRWARHGVPDAHASHSAYQHGLGRGKPAWTGTLPAYLKLLKKSAWAKQPLHGKQHQQQRHRQAAHLAVLPGAPNPDLQRGV